MASFGQASIDPGERWVIFEKRGAYDAAPAYDLYFRSVWASSGLWLAPIGDPETPPQRLLPEGEGPGLLFGAWSPSGDRLLIYRLRGGRLEPGVVELSDRSVWWTGLSADLAITGSVAAWLDENTLALTTYPGGDAPRSLSHFGRVQAEMPPRWAAQRTGREATRTVIDTEGGVATSEVREPSRAVVALDVQRREIVILDEGGIRDWAASPDGRTLAVLKSGPGLPFEPDRLAQLAPLERGRLDLIDRESGQRRAVADRWDVAGNLLRWSPDSDALLVWVRAEGRAWADGELARIEADGRLTVIPRDDLHPLRARGDIDSLVGVKADWMGATPVLYARRGENDRFDWYAMSSAGAPRVLTADLAAPAARLAGVTDDGLLIFADGALWEIGEAGGNRLSASSMSVTEGERPDRMVPVRLRVNAAPRRNWALAEVTADQTLRAIDRVGRTQILGAMEAGRENRVLAAGQGSAVVIGRDHGVETLQLLSGGRSRTLDQLNGGLADLAMSRPIPVRHRNTAGEDATSWLFLPPGRDQAIKGVVVLAYPGAADSGRFITLETTIYGPRAAMLAAEGYAVLSPDIPVTSRGSGSIANFEAGIDLAVDAMQAAYPALPTDRMALLGHSFGGYTTLGVAARSQRFRSYIAWAAPSDMFAAWGEFTPQNRVAPDSGFALRERMGWVEANQGGLAGPPWTDPQAYMDASAFLVADQITAPLLLISGEIDFVTQPQAERMFSALNRTGGRARLITYWGEWHNNISPANILDVYAEITRWLDETLGEPAVTADVRDAPPSVGANPPWRPQP